MPAVSALLPGDHWVCFAYTAAWGGLSLHLHRTTNHHTLLPSDSSSGTEPAGGWKEDLWPLTACHLEGTASAGPTCTHTWEYTYSMHSSIVLLPPLLSWRTVDSLPFHLTALPFPACTCHIDQDWLLSTYTTYFLPPLQSYLFWAHLAAAGSPPRTATRLPASPAGTHHIVRSAAPRATDTLPLRCTMGSLGFLPPTLPPQDHLDACDTGRRYLPPGGCVSASWENLPPGRVPAGCLGYSAPACHTLAPACHNLPACLRSALLPHCCRYLPAVFCWTLVEGLRAACTFPAACGFSAALLTTAPATYFTCDTWDTTNYCLLCCWEEDLATASVHSCHLHPHCLLLTCLYCSPILPGSTCAVGLHLWEDRIHTWDCHHSLPALCKFCYKVRGLPLAACLWTSPPAGLHCLHWDAACITPLCTGGPHHLPGRDCRDSASCHSLWTCTAIHHCLSSGGTPACRTTCTICLPSASNWDHHTSAPPFLTGGHLLYNSLHLSPAYHHTVGLEHSAIDYRYRLPASTLWVWSLSTVIPLLPLSHSLEVSRLWEGCLPGITNGG